MTKLLPIFLLLLPGTVNADWTKEEIVIESIYMTTVLIDWKQTLKIANNPGTYHEYNPLLGKHPSRRKVNIYMPVGMVTHYLISDNLNHKWRRRFQYFTLGFETEIIILNYRIGL